MLISDRASNGQTYYYLLDAQESVVAVTDSSGNVLNSYVYDPYGNLYLDNETVANPWQFESGYQDGSTGLLKFGTRYYNPSLGRWTQQDPVGGSLADAQGLNRYLFVRDNPVNRVDPSGKDLFTCVVGVIAAISAVFITDYTFVAPILLGILSLGGPVADIVAVVIALLGSIALLAGAIYLCETGG